MFIIRYDSPIVRIIAKTIRVKRDLKATKTPIKRGQGLSLVLTNCIVSQSRKSLLERQPQKMIKHIQSIRRPLPTNCLSMFDNLWGWRLKG